MSISARRILEVGTILVLSAACFLALNGCSYSVKGKTFYTYTVTGTEASPDYELHQIQFPSDSTWVADQEIIESGIYKSSSGEYKEEGNIITLFGANDSSMVFKLSSGNGVHALVNTDETLGYLDNQARLEELAKEDLEGIKNGLAEKIDELMPILEGEWTDVQEGSGFSRLLRQVLTVSISSERIDGFDEETVNNSSRTKNYGACLV